MSTYIIGDIQGCMDALSGLLDSIHYNPSKDCIFAVGDLVNRGKHSLEVLRFARSLGDSFKTVLGNHDLHLLAVAFGATQTKRGDTLDPILSAPDRNELIDWLIHQPLLITRNNMIVVHAGLPHIWSINEANTYAREVEDALRGSNPTAFLKEMYGDFPTKWNNDLTGTTRLRAITNYLTRMRVCAKDGTLNLGYKGPPDHCPTGYSPWFAHRNPATDEAVNIFFGHWATLPAISYSEKYHALDSGCVWGNSLTAYDFEAKSRITFPHSQLSNN